jgi:hypothetical protein
MGIRETLAEHGIERRISQRRGNFERRFAERRCLERAQLGRRVLFVTERRVLGRRASDRRELAPRV